MIVMRKKNGSTKVKTCLNVTLPTINPTRNGSEHNAESLGDGLAISRLIYGMT